MLKVVLIGQSWLGVKILELLIKRGDRVLKVFGVCRSDKLGIAAGYAGVPFAESPRLLMGDDIPGDTDVIIAAHCHSFIHASSRNKTRFGALGYHPSLLPRHRGRDAVH